MKQTDQAFFRQNGFINLGKILSDEEVDHFRDLFDEDRRRFPYFWHPYGHHQEANYDALVTTPAFDGLIRHPAIYGTIRELMGGPLCFGEIGLRSMGPYKGALHQRWHRDKAHWFDHPRAGLYPAHSLFAPRDERPTHSYRPKGSSSPY